jgi:drug/metabolite transporter (DMT)-like permease
VALAFRDQDQALEVDRALRDSGSEFVLLQRAVARGVEARDMIFGLATTWAAVLGAIAYGSGDFIGGCVTRRLGTFCTVAIAQSVAVAFMMQDYALAQRSLPIEIQGWVSVAAGIAYAIGLMSIYEGLGHGRIAIVASICGLLSIVVPLAGDLTLGRDIAQNEFTGIALCAAAALLIVGASGDCGDRESIGWSVRLGVTSGLGFGIADLGLGTMPPELAAGSLFITRIVAATIAVVLALGFLRRISSKSILISAPASAVVASVPGSTGSQPTGMSLGLTACVALAMTAGLLDTLGHVGYVHAATHGSMGVAAALVAIFPGVTVLLAAIVLRERITRTQLVGFGFGAGGIIFISV